MSTDNPLRDATCVVGVGNTAYGNFPETDAYGLGADALNAALEDAGLAASDIDGLIVHRIPSYERFAEVFGLSGQTYGAQLPSSGRMSSVSIMMAAMALHAGELRVGLLRPHGPRKGDVPEPDQPRVPADGLLHHKRIEIGPLRIDPVQA